MWLDTCWLLWESKWQSYTFAGHLQKGTERKRHSGQGKRELVFIPHNLLHIFDLTGSVLCCSRAEGDLKHNFVICPTVGSLYLCHSWQKFSNRFWKIQCSSQSPPALPSLVSQKPLMFRLSPAVSAPCCSPCPAEQTGSLFHETEFYIFEDHDHVLRLL